VQKFYILLIKNTYYETKLKALEKKKADEMEVAAQAHEEGKKEKKAAKIIN